MKKNTSNKIIKLFKAKFFPYKKIVINIGHPSEKLINFIQEKIKINVTDYYHQIDNYSLKHIRKNHPNIKIADLIRIPEILKNPDKISHEGKSKQEVECFKYKKAFNGTTYYIEEVRTGSKTLSLKTMYKRKTLSGASHAS